MTTKYSPFSNGVYGTVSQGRQGTVSFAVSNNLEMKVKSDRDSTGVRKISLIENLSANMSYNMAADSMKWSNLNTSILIKLTKNFNLQMSAVWDTYTYQLRPVREPRAGEQTPLDRGQGDWPVVEHGYLVLLYLQQRHLQEER